MRARIRTSGARLRHIQSHGRPRSLFDSSRGGGLCDDVSALDERCECSTNVEGGVGLERAFRGCADRVALQNRLAEDELGGLEAGEMEFTARAADFEPYVLRRKMKFAGRRVGEIELHQLVDRP